MLVTALLALSAVFVGLWITGTEMNISSMMGMTMIVGIVTEVAIFYYSEYADLTGEQNQHVRLIKAGNNRMRPIAMTTLAAAFALLPLALGIGQGAAIAAAVGDCDHFRAGRATPNGTYYSAGSPRGLQSALTGKGLVYTVSET